MFGYTIIKKKKLEYYKMVEARDIERTYGPKPTLNCGYKSCQFQTTDPKGLKIHRARVHRKK